VYEAIEIVKCRMFCGGKYDQYSLVPACKIAPFSEEDAFTVLPRRSVATETANAVYRRRCHL
jgi:hypothetical protein